MKELPDSMIWLAGGGLAAVALLLWWSFPRRKRVMIRLLRGTGFLFVGHQSGLSWRQFIGVPLLSGDKHGRFLRVMRGTHKGSDALLFDFKHVSANAKSRTASVVTFRLPFGRVPSFELRDRKNADGPVGRVRGVPVKFEEHSQFSERFELIGMDAEGIRKLFDRRLRSYLLDLGKRLCVECSGGYLVVYYFGTLVPAFELPTLLRRSQRIYGALMQTTDRKVAQKESQTAIRQAS